MKKIKKIKIKINGKIKSIIQDSNLSMVLKNLKIPLNKVAIELNEEIIDKKKINGVKLRLQKIDGLPPKELRKLVDKGKKDLGEGIVVVFANKDNKVGVAVGVTNKLTEKYDAVKFVKISSEIIGGQGGGGGRGTRSF